MLINLQKHYIIKEICYMRIHPSGRHMKKYIDIHSHIIPGVDDGARSIDTSMRMLQIAADDGISEIILTPHNKPGHHPVDFSALASKVEELQKRLSENDTAIKLYIGNEIYYRSELVSEIENGLAATLAGTHYVLVEFGPLEDYDYIRSGIYTLLMNGYRPVLAHAERYRNIRVKKLGLEDLAAMGCYIQLNADSIMGKYGFEVRQFTRKLLKKELVHFIATDAHDIDKRAPRLSACAEYITKKYGEDYASDLLYDNPYKAIRDEEIPIWKNR